MTEAYRSALDISFDVKAGLLIRQTHHWAADVFLVAIVLHLLRVFFTGAYRKPRELTYLIGVTMLALALLEGYLGYSLVDDLLSGMGLAIGYSVLVSVPLVGANLALLVWGGAVPRRHRLPGRGCTSRTCCCCRSRSATLLALHLLLVASRHHTQFARPAAGRTGGSSGCRCSPRTSPRTLGLLFAVAAVLVLLGGLAQINPIWLWGPYHVDAGTNGAQPDWYLGWLIGALRLVPGFDVVIGGRTVVPNPFWGGALFPGVVFGFLYLWPWLERRFTRRPRLGERARPPARPPEAHRYRRRARDVAVRDLPRRLRRPRVGDRSASRTPRRSGPTACSSSWRPSSRTLLRGACAASSSRASASRSAGGGPRRRRCDEPNRSRCRTERSEETVARNQGGTMSGIDVDTGEHPQIARREPEESDTFRWRFDQLVLAGYSEHSARRAGDERRRRPAPRVRPARERLPGGDGGRDPRLSGYNRVTARSDEQRRAVRGEHANRIASERAPTGT